LPLVVLLYAAKVCSCVAVFTWSAGAISVTLLPGAVLHQLIEWVRYWRWFESATDKNQTKSGALLSTLSLNLEPGI